MKNSILLLLSLCILGSSVFAEELQPAQESENNVATIAIQKQPATENIQKQSIKQNKWCIIIQINGKVKDNGNTDK